MKNGDMKLEQIGERLHLTAARIKQVEQEVLSKLSKRKSFFKIIMEE